MEYEVGDIVKLKKPHPCGSQEWEILRVGADFRLKCLGCGHMVMVTRRLVEKNTRGLRKPEKKGIKKRAVVKARIRLYNSPFCIRLFSSFSFGVHLNDPGLIEHNGAEYREDHTDQHHKALHSCQREHGVDAEHH